MGARDRYLSCQDNRIELTDDAKTACAQVLNGKAGQIIPGSEHRCGRSDYLPASILLGIRGRVIDNRRGLRREPQTCECAQLAPAIVRIDGRGVTGVNLGPVQG
jgi:hypothetical protein